ncbi:glycoside hydrolase family 28 protein [Paraflavisolibacter sp. H34]|uniref:glycoside hydrolase family 28 protein n=1 Tax=Huijunlia imazamoxiresistens TaxID=3127457 RepID=UPI0030189CD1
MGPLHFFFLFLFTVSVANAAPSNRQKTYIVTDFGAVGDGRTLNTTAIQQTIDRCAREGGGRVVVPAGIFVSGALFLKKGVALRVEKEGVLKGSVNRDDYPMVATRWEGTEMNYMCALVNADSLDGVSLTGEGTIDGSGDSWLEMIRNEREQGGGPARWMRPRLIGIQNSRNVVVKGLRLHNQAVWCVHILYCENVELTGLHITANHNIPSSDGIDIDSDRNVKISRCFIDVNDDCISIKSGKDEDGLRVARPSENIVIEKCRFGYGHGGVAMGSETSGGIRNVVVRRCIAETDNWAPIRFKSQPSRGGVVENITYKNFRLNNTRKAVEFNMAWRMVPPVKPPAAVLPVVRNVRLVKIKGTVTSVGDIRGLAASPIRGVVFKKCSLRAQKTLVVEHAEQIDLSGLKQVIEKK